MSALDELAASLGSELGTMAARIERDLKQLLALEFERLRAERAEFELRIERAVAARLAVVKDGEPGPPGEPADLDVPDDIVPLIAKAQVLLADVPAMPAPVVNVTVPLPQPRVERSRVRHDEHGRIVEIERDVA